MVHRDASRTEVRVFLIDEHEAVLASLRETLEAEADLVVVGEARTTAHALARMPALRPDVVVLSVGVPDGRGVSECREIRSRMPELACLMLTPRPDDEALLDAIMGGAAGYVIKQIRGEFADAIRSVAAGRSMLDPGATAAVLESIRSDRGDGRLIDLAEDERRLVELIGQGLTNRQIAARLFLAEQTVRDEVRTLLAGLGVETAAAARPSATRGHGADSP
ncbi:MAG: response regulator [Carbonactinosporaceae bacterium]